MKPISVSMLNAYIGRLIYSDCMLGAVSVKGEVSNFKRHSKGHVYFSLKDAKSKVNCFLPSETDAALRVDFKDGIEIIADGFVSVYEKGGYYSLAIRDVRIEGPGSLFESFEALKSRLADEGLFDMAHKKPIPKFPRAVAIVTSESGAALQDILKTIRSRNGVADILVCPAQVQGQGAAADIADAIEAVNRLRPDIDCMIVGRGGGSAEELWAFNEEAVARGIFASRIPVISAVGHETDFTIADFVADRRAETPTAAAQMAVPDMRPVSDRLDRCRRGLSYGAARLFERLSLRLVACDADVLGSAALRRADAAAWRLSGLRSDLARLAGGMAAACGESAETAAAGLRGMDPAAVIGRGYAMLSDAAGNPVPSVGRVKEKDVLTATLRDGSISLEARGISPAPSGGTGSKGGQHG
jgi:exodeoxyribonuclease VII large subunit